MKKYRLLMATVIALQLVGCAAGPSLEEEDTVVNPPTQPATSVSPSLEPAEPVAPETQAPTNIPEIPTSTPEITPTSAPVPAGYCDYDAAMEAVSRIDALMQAEDGSEDNSNSDQPLSEEDKKLAIAISNQKINDLDAMEVPGCLQESVQHLRAWYTAFRDLISAPKDQPIDKTLELITIGDQEHTLFVEEFERVKACIPTGCQ